MRVGENWLKRKNQNCNESRLRQLHEEAYKQYKTYINIQVEGVALRRLKPPHLKIRHARPPLRISSRITTLSVLRLYLLYSKNKYTLSCRLLLTFFSVSFYFHSFSTFYLNWVVRYSIIHLFL